MIISSISTTSLISKTYKSWPFPNHYPVFIFNNFVKLLKMKKMLSSNNWLFNEKINQSGHSPDTLPTRRLEKKTTSTCRGKPLTVCVITICPFSFFYRVLEEKSPFYRITLPFPPLLVNLKIPDIHTNEKAMKRSLQSSKTFIARVIQIILIIANEFQ